MISLSDLVTLAKAGYGPKQVKELVELFQTVPEVKEAEVTADGKVEIKKEEEPKPDPKPETNPQEEDAIEVLKNLLKEE